MDNGPNFSSLFPFLLHEDSLAPIFQTESQHEATAHNYLEGHVLHKIQYSRYLDTAKHPFQVSMKM